MLAADAAVRNMAAMQKLLRSLLAAATAVLAAGCANLNLYSDEELEPLRYA
jgi:hypothetical protein